jgi:chloramphenicol-sensitive protein RarD
MGAGAYFLWGLVPLFWPLLAPASSAEALAHRFVWSMALVLLLLVVTRRLGHFRAAVGVGGVAVAVLTIDHGRPPWIALLLAGSFATYGFLKKQAQLGALESLGAETLLLTPVALAFLLWLEANGRGTFGHAGAANVALLISTGIVTAIPLLLFGGAATRLSLSTLGVLQYLGPALQFVFGLLIFNESMTEARWAGFILVWLALVIFTVDGLRSHRRLLRQTVESVAT